MLEAPPPYILLIPDNHHLTDVGKLEDGRLYWIDIQLDSENGKTRDFVCTYIFDTDGNLVSHDIVDLGLRGDYEVSASEIVDSKLEALGKTREQRIEIRPFSVEAYNRTFGLVVREDEGDPEAEPVVDALPGWTIMFYPPFSKGGYDS